MKNFLKAALVVSLAFGFASCENKDHGKRHHRDRHHAKKSYVTQQDVPSQEAQSESVETSE